MDIDMKYFTLGELISSETADRYGINNRCNKEQAENLMKLVGMVLDPLREAYGKPIIVTSGFRCQELNDKVRGAKNSHHLRGMAADIVAKDRRDNAKLFRLAQQLPFTQLIWEKGTKENPAWIHVSYEEGNIKKQVLRL